MDDARLVVAIARTAAAYGARILTGAAVTAVDGYDVHAIVDNSEAVTVRAAGGGQRRRGVGAAAGARASGCCPRAARTWSCAVTGSARRPPR